MKRKLISSLLVLVMIAGTLTACGQKPANNNTPAASESKQESKVESTDKKDEPASEPAAEEFSYPMDRTDDVLTMAMMNYHFKQSYDYVTLDDTPFWEEFQKRVGVTIELDTYETEDAYNLMLASGDLPDILSWSNLFDAGGARKLVDEETIRVLTWEEIEKWAPNLYGILTAEGPIAENIRKTLAIDGGIMGFPSAKTDSYGMTSSGLTVRADWLEDLGLEAPETPDELLDMLRKFKTEKGAQYPLALNQHRMNLILSYGHLSSAYDLITYGEYVKDGKYHIGWIEDGAKETIALVNTMYEEGLINQDYLTIEQAALDAMVYDGRTGMFEHMITSGLGKYLGEIEAQGLDIKLKGISGLKRPNGENPYYGGTEDPVGSFKTFISTCCEDVELAMRVIDYNYSPEGEILRNYGIEGITFEWVDGKPVYTEFVTNNPDGFALQNVVNAYAGSGFHNINTPEKFVLSNPRPEQVAAIDVWNANDRYTYKVPPFALLDEYNSEYSEIWADISTYYTDQRAKFISGERPIDEYDDFIKEVKDMGIDRCIEIKQMSLDAWNDL